jgi:8-oxo-dGTP pyrophosphatase MutT (NUDIX family)
MRDFGAFCDMLRAGLERPLPGGDAHSLMSPSHRSSFPPASSDVREGAVMIVLYPDGDGVSTLFTVRRKDLVDHAGQISFPGGKREDGETFEDAAVRECEEEVGIDPTRIDVIGSLSPLYIPPTRFIVHPFVGAVEPLPEIIPQEREVDEVLHVPLTVLQDPGTQRSEEWTIRGKPSTVPFFHVDGHVIWGATAMITAELLELLAEIRNL